MLTKQDLEGVIREKNQAVLVVNMHSRRSARRFSAAREALVRGGISLVASYPVRHPERIPEVVKEAVAGGCRWLILGSGDGTVSSVVDSLAYQDVALGLLPLGTSNSFARTLGIPRSLGGAVDVLIHGKVADVDLGKVNDHYFANAASIGLSAAVTRSASHGLKRYFGRLAYPLGGIKTLLSYKPFECRFSAAERSGTVRTHQVMVANGRIHGGMLLAPDASADNRNLIFFTLGETSRWQLVKTWALASLGRHTTLPEANYFVTRDVMIDTVPALPVDIDGEVTTHTPVRITLAPEALRVVVPAAFEEPLG